MITFLEGDVINQLKTRPRCSVQCVVTSPPYYGLRDYGIDGQIGMEETPELFVSKIVEVFREVKRVLRDDGTLWLNFGDSYCGGGTGHKEMGKAVYEGSDYDDAAKNRTKIAGMKSKDLIGIPWMVAFALRADGWYLRSDIIWSKPNPMPESVSDRPTKAHEYVFLMTKSARYYYDADAIKEIATGYDGRQDTMMKGSEKYKDGTMLQCGNANSCSVKGRERWKYKNLQADGQDPNSMHLKRLVGEEYLSPIRNKRTVWEIATQPTPEAHFATFPEALVEPCIKAGTSERGCCAVCGAPMGRTTKPSDEYAKALGKSWNTKNDIKNMDVGNVKDSTTGSRFTASYQTTGWQPTCKCNADTVPCVVLDPFGGSGTTAKVATKLNRDCILIELNHDYIRIAKKKNGLAPLPYSHAKSLGFDVKVMKHEVW